jgi:hypothetical protein
VLFIVAWMRDLMGWNVCTVLLLTCRYRSGPTTLHGVMLQLDAVDTVHSVAWRASVANFMMLP